MDIIPQFSQLIQDLDLIDAVNLPQKVIKINTLLENYSADFPKLGNAAVRLCEKIMKIKNVNNQCVEYYENLINEVIRISINNQFRVGFDALRFVFNPNSDFYKSANLDVSLSYPLGKKRPLQQYNPQVGQQCDTVKPYITSTGFCGWTRCIVLSQQSNKYTLKYANSNNPNTVKQKPWFAPIGSRTPDYQWRMSLQIGSHIQALLNRVWYKSTIVEVGHQNDTKKVRVTYRRFDPQGDREDSQGNKYFGLSINEDQWLDVLSSRIQMCGKMAFKKLCYYTFNSEQILPEDNYDILFQKQYKEKPFYGIMRIVNCKSLSIITFINQFVAHKGIEKLLEVMNISDFNDEIVFTILTHIGVMTSFFPQMFIRQKILFELYERIPIYFKQVSKSLNPYKIDIGYFCYDILGRRLYSLTEVYMHQNQLRKILIRQFLKMNMEKQMLALRYINDLINPKKPYTLTERQAFNKFIVDEAVFTQIFNLNTHQQIISRSGTLLQYLIQKQIITEKEFQSLWRIFPATDTRGRAIIQKLLAQVCKNIPMSYVNFLISKILSLKESQLTVDNLNLLRQLKNRDIGSQNQLRVLTFLWEILTVKSINIKTSIQEQVQKVFKTLISTIKDPKIRMNLLQSMSQKLQYCKKIKSQIQLLKDFIKSYPQKYEKAKQKQIQSNYPLTIYNAVTFLKTQNIYQGLLSLLFKSKQEQTKKDIFNFLQFLFSYDNEDINTIIKHVYEKLGPSVNFFEWVLMLMPRSMSFVVQLLQKTEDFSQYQKLPLRGYQALQNMILLINSECKNIRIIKTHQYNTTSSVFSIGNKPKKQKQGTSNIIQLKYYIYVLVSPFKLIGIKFLQHLLQVVKESSVYNTIIKMIIHLMTNLDESIQQNTLKYRKQFLQDIIKEIKSIVQDGIFNQKIKAKLQVYINLLTEIFGQTQKNGIDNIQPHFQKVQGERITLNIQNLFYKQKNKNISTSFKFFKVICNENCTIWRLKKIIADIIKQKAQNIDIYKHIDPLSDTANGKSLSQLLFFDNQNIKIDKKKTKYIPRSNLLNQDGTNVSQKFQKIIKIIFDQFKDKELNGLSFSQIQNLSNQRWKNSFFKQKESIQKILEEHDKEKKGYLNYSDFKEFFYKKSIKNQSLVWRIINLSGFKNDFSHSSSNLQERQAQNNLLVQQSAQTLPRRILSCPQVYRLIFSIFEKYQFKQVHLIFYRLLTLLQVNKDLHKEIEANIYKIIKQEKSVFTLCYFLQASLSQLSKKQDFYFNFWNNNGIKIIEQRVYQFLKDQKPIHQMQTLIKMLIIPTLVKILHLYTSQLLNNYKTVRFITNNRINLFQPHEFDKKYKQFNQIQSIQNIGNQMQSKLRQKGQVETTLKLIYNLADKIFNNLLHNFSQMVAYLQKLIIQTVRLLGCIVATKRNYHNFNTLEYLKGIKNRDLNCRRSCVIILYIFIFYSQNTTYEQVEQILSKMLQQMPYENKSENYNYFSLLNQITTKYQELNATNKQKDQYFISLAHTLLNKLFSEVSSQSRTALLSDKIVLGILTNFDSLLQRQSTRKALTQRKIEIAQKCLFIYNIQQKLKQLKISQQDLLNKRQSQHFRNYVICKTDDSRKLVYNIIIKLHEISYNQEENFLINFILPVIKSIAFEVRVTDQKDLDVGLKNYGSTCYMNSMLQVLNSVGPFRNALMKCESQTPLIHQLKKLFAALYFSQRRDYGPAKLLEAFNPPINPGIQQDTTQFLNFLFDQIEVQLSKTKYKRVLNQIFKGANTVQMICHSCGYKKENKQQFFSFGVEIQGKTDLEAALQGSYQGEVISGYLCDSCHNKGQTTKRNLLSQIPSILFIHLRRIVFNYDMFVNMKIHSRLKFPEELNIQPYTKEGVQLRESLGLQYMKNLAHNQSQLKKFNLLAEHGKQKDFYKLKLKGVIVHSGSADVGHYYSILYNQKTWRKYDDSRVSTFGYNGFENECYGGTFTPEEWGTGTSMNAYVLVYEKVIKNSIWIMDEGLEGQKYTEYKYDQIKTFNSPEDYKQLWLDNHNFMVESQLLDSKQGRDFINFVCQLMKIEKNCRKKIELISEIIYRISYHSGLIGQLLNLLRANTNQVEPQIFYNYVVKDKIRTFKLLFSHQRALRDLMANYLEIVLIHSFAKGDEKVRLDVKNFITEYLNALTGQVAKNWLRIDGYFKLLFLLLLDSTNHKELWQLFISKNLISTLIDFVLEKQSPVKISSKNYSLGTKSNPMEFSYAIGVISFLLRHTYGFTGKNYEQAAIPQQFIFHLNDNDVLCLSCMEFYAKMIKERQNLHDLAAIIHRLSIQNLQFSKAICKVVLQAIGFITDSKDQIIDICMICFQILNINDKYWTHRAEMLLGIGFPSVINQNLMTNFQQESFIYLSTIYDIFPAQSLFEFIYINHTKNTLACFQLTRVIIQGCSINQESKKFIARQPSPTYLFPNLLSWFENFIQTFISFVSVQPKHKERLQLQVSLTLKYIQELNRFIKENQTIDFYQSLITGQISNKKQIALIQKQGIQVRLYEYEVYCLRSNPQKNGGNSAMQNYLQHNRLTKPVTNNSNILKFFKNPSKAITLKLKPVEQDEDKQIVSLFDDDPYPTVSTKKQNIVKEEKKIQVNNQNIIQQKQQPKQTQVNIEGVFTNNYIREIFVFNNSKEKRIVRLYVDCEGVPNSNFPKEITYNIMQKSNESIWLAKQNVQKEWGKLIIKVQTEQYIKQKNDKANKKNWFKIYERESQNGKQMKQSLTDKIETQIQNQKQQNQQNAKQTTENTIQEFGKQCQVCTFFNSFTNAECQMCGSPMQQ